MRALPVLLPVLAVAVTVTACSGSGSVPVKPRATLAAVPAIGCDQVLQQNGPPGGRILFGVLAVPPAQLQRAAPTGSQPWSYFTKYGLSLRANSPAVLAAIPKPWRHGAAIEWGSNIGPVSSLRLLSCPQQLGPWNGYAGGFYLRSATGCVPVVFQIGRRTATVRFAVGRRCAA